MSDEWFERAACRGKPTNWWFPRFDSVNISAVTICRGCAVKDECLTYAVADPELLGTWGGVSEQERRRMRRGDMVSLMAGIHRALDVAVDERLMW
jgi:WhiB family redox-sensing transcriptional regulator